MEVILGDMILKDWEKPDFVNLGGTQSLAVRNFPGGFMSVQNMGPRYDDITWTGQFIGVDAWERMMKIGMMRTKGKPIRFKTSKFDDLVMLKSFKADFKTELRIPFSITVFRFSPPIPYKQPVVKKEDPIVKVLKKEEATTAVVEKKETKTKTYIIKEGDTLSRIAKEHYKDANKWPQLYEKNKKVLVRGPHDIRPGWVLEV